ncbi:magnesium/cobalt transporter CorA [Salmonirosea aquatica]|uniref:Magnesium transport protein CorA n=1 Tax=Salmonirosea aquatica TaxID=2654236 RepID=A0A7C9BD80_9BACT|nr:magnesium/cobalt transporter CorA [Cytophagaceae bacterium SJW1-29]
MARPNHRKHRKNLLTSPGTLTYVGEKTNIKTVIKRIEYNDSFYQEEVASTMEVCIPKKVPTDQPYITWLNVTGIHEPQVMEQIGKLYQLHPLLLEDVMNSYQKPKVEAYEDGHLFITMKMLHLGKTGAGGIWGEHVSFVLGKDYLVSFQEQQSGDVFTPVIDRLKGSVGKTRRSGSDYLLYALMDVIVDNYFLLLENFSDQLDQMEDQVINGRHSQSLGDLYDLKRELTYTRRLIWPLRDMLTQLVRADDPLVSKRVFPYMRDVNDHVMQIIENLDAYRELLASLVDVHLSTISNRMNEVMKTLTIFSAIFMPITFIVGVYGMNFDNMPELHERYGYYTTWAAMALVTLGMLLYFRWKKWL